MKSLAELQAIKDKMKNKVVLRDGINEFRVVVGMATCGIAAGARPVLNTMVEAINEGGLSDKVSVAITGGFTTFGSPDVLIHNMSVAGK